MSKRNILLALGVSSMFLACGDGEESTRLSVLRDKPTIDVNAEAERKRKMQAIIATKDGESKEIYLPWAAEFRCAEQIAQTELTTDTYTTWRTNCTGQCDVALQICTAEVQLTLAQGNGMKLCDVLWAGPVCTQITPGYWVEPQPASARAKLAKDARDRYRRATDATQGQIWLHKDDGIGLDKLAAALAESYVKAEEAGALAFELILAVSDAERSTTPSLELGVHRSVTAAELSRSAAAAVQFGGFEIPPDEGEEGDDEPFLMFPGLGQGMCTQPRLSPPAEGALAILREAALAPEYIIALPNSASANPISTQDLLTSTACPGGSVLQRLGDKWSIDPNEHFEFTDANSEIFGLRLQDFEEARRYLAQDITINGRSLTQQMPGSSEFFPRYAATATKGAQQNSAFYAAIARSADVVGMRESGPAGGNPVRWYLSEADWNLAECHLPVPFIYNGGRDIQRELMRNLIDCLAAQVAPEHRGALAVLDPIRADLDRGWEGTLSHAYFPLPNENYLTLTVPVAEESRGYRVVRGEEALSCYTTGMIEGVPCADIEIGRALGTDGWDGWILKDLVVPMPPEGQDVPFSELDLTPQRWYLLRSRATGTTEGAARRYWTNGVGEWEALTGFVPGPGRQPLGGRRKIPIYRDLEDSAKTVLAPNPSWCSEPATSCVGLGVNDPIPLEDELSADGSDYESSWRHYLDMAEAAATKADDLGKSYIEVSISNDEFQLSEERFRQAQEEKAMGKLDTIQDICGTKVDPATLLRALGGGIGDGNMDYDLAALEAGPCTDASPGDEYECLGGRWVKSWRKVADSDPELGKLRDCLLPSGAGGPGSTEDFVHLGDASLCVPDAVKRRACGGTTDSNPCGDVAIADLVQVVDDGNTDMVEQCTRPGDHLVGPEQGLGFFQTRAELGDLDDDNTCEQIRKAQRSRAQDAVDALKFATKLDLANLRSAAENLKLEPRYGGYVGIYAGDRMWATGSTETGPGANQWPCQTDPLAPELPQSCKDNSGYGLFCTTPNCSDPYVRALINERLMDAVIAAKLLVWDNTDEDVAVPLPTYVYGGLHPAHSQGTPLQAWTGAEPVAISLWSGGDWQLFDGSADDVAWLTLSEPAPDRALIEWPLSGINDGIPEAFAFRTQSATPPVVADRMLAGLGNAPGEGCLRRWLLGNPEAMKDCAETFHVDDRRESKLCDDFGAGNWVDWMAYSAMLGLAEDVGLGATETELEAALDIVADEDACRQLDADDFRLWLFNHDDYIRDYEMFTGAFIDGLELLCEAQSPGTEQADCGAEPPPPSNVESLGALGTYMECLGRKIQTKAALAVFRDVPRAVLDPFRNNGSSVYENATGQLNQALGRVRTALMGTYSAQSTIGHTVRQVGSAIKGVQAVFRQYAAEEKIADITFESTRVREITSCLSSASSLIGLSTLANPGNIGSSAATCANSFAQIRFADQLRDARKEGLEAAAEGAIANFDETFSDKSLTLDRVSSDLQQGLEDINLAIGAVLTLRAQVDREFSDVLWLLSTQAKTSGEVRMALTNRKALTYEQYRRAQLNARKLAFLAKRAIEQRLGIRLDSMVENLPLVEAPATWESTVCSNAGVDYEALKAAELGEGEVSALADGFVGDYVTKLRNVIESYRLQEGFQNGQDTAVVSIRDDLLGVRQLCEVESRNLFRSTEALQPEGYHLSGSTRGWYVDWCNGWQNITTDLAEPPSGCVGVERLGETVMPTGAESPSQIFRVILGHGTDNDPCNGPGECDWVPEAGLVQDVELEPGFYALSWQDRSSLVGFPLLPAVEADDQSSIIDPNWGDALLTPTEQHWVKRWYTFEVTNPVTAQVGFRANVSGENVKASIEMAAPMLERISEREAVENTGMSIGFYDATSINGTTRRRTCEDRDGDAFRRLWTRGCLKLCSDGYSSDCSDYMSEACYREIVVPVTQKAIDSNEIFSQSGFARGNFNYRFNKVGVNVVGTGVRDCSTVTTGQTCHGAGYATYTLLHEGPYFVRNHLGADFEASLFNGRIEHARALAAERYITNPIGSTDRGLLNDYMRREYAGRPLNGVLRLRVWEEPGVNFQAIQDVQLIIDYGYWTRPE